MSVQPVTPDSEIEETLDCPRNNCDESFHHDNDLIRLLRQQRHLATDHDDLRDEVDGYPRPPSQR